MFKQYFFERGLRPVTSSFKNIIFHSSAHIFNTKRIFKYILIPISNAIALITSFVPGVFDFNIIQSPCVLQPILNHPLPCLKYHYVHLSIWI